MEAVVLAGGFGTRLRNVVSSVPKPMAPVAGRPFLEHLLGYAEAQGVERAVLAVGYKWETIRDHFGDSYGGLRLDYSVEEEPLGTGGAIRDALGLIKSDVALVLNGDTFFAADYKKLLEFHRQRCATVLIALREMENVDRYGSVEIDSEGKVIRFIEKQRFAKCLINGGVYIVRSQLFEGDSFPQRFSFENDFLEKNRVPTYGIVQNSTFIDIGIPQDYDAAQDLLSLEGLR